MGHGDFQSVRFILASDALTESSLAFDNLTLRLQVVVYGRSVKRPKGNAIHYIKKGPKQVRPLKVEEGIRTPDPRNHNPML